MAGTEDLNREAQPLPKVEIRDSALGSLQLLASGPSRSPGCVRPGLKQMAQACEPARSQRLMLRDGREVTLRAITEADAPAIQRAFDHLSSESRYSRFMQHKKHLDPAALIRGVHPRPGQDFVLVATVEQADRVDIVAGAQYVRAQPNDESTCEFAITVAEDWRGCGLAGELLKRLMYQARCDHYAKMMGLVLAENAAMLALTHRLGFTEDPCTRGRTAVQLLCLL